MQCRKHTRATKLKLRKMRLGKNNPFWGKTHTEEFKAAARARLLAANAIRHYEILPMRLKKIKPDIAGYLAGLIDGEGSIHFKKGQPTVYIHNTCWRLMKFLKQIGGSVRTRGGRNRPGLIQSTKPCHCWSVGGARNIAYLLKMVIPYLTVKVEEAASMYSALTKKYGDRLWQ